MVVVTPTYAPDLELFADLHRSVLRCFPRDVRHVVVVDDADLDRFHHFAGPRCVVVGVRDLLPRSLRAVPGTRLWVDVRRPLPPVRGWILQQLVKLAATEHLHERLVVVADSDLVFVRPVTAATFAPEGRARLYRNEGGVTATLGRHLRWHAAARSLLGLPPPPPPPLPDYVSSLNTWDRDVARRMLRRIEGVVHRRWPQALGGRLHLSEWTLYGLHADQVERAAGVAVTDRSLCHAYWDPTPLATGAAARFLAGVAPDDVAYMISAKSGTSLDARRRAHAEVFGA